MPEEPLDKSYLDRKYFIDSKVYNCPFCNRRNVSYILTGHLKFDWNADKECYAYVARCSSCKKNSMHLSYDHIFRFAGNDGQGNSFWMFREDVEDIDSRIFYSVPTSFFTIDSRVPKVIRELITEADGCLKMNYLTGASACARKAIYVLLVQESATGDTYEERIKSLKSKYTSIDPELFDILGHIQQMTSDKIHEHSWDQWDSPTLTLIIETLNAVLFEICVHPDEKKQTISRIQKLREQALGKSSSRNSHLDHKTA